MSVTSASTGKDAAQGARDDAPPPPDARVGGSAVRASVWAIGSFGAAQLLRFGSNLILTRLLYPEVFGLMALVFAFISGLWMFSDIGITPSVVQNPRGDDEGFLRTAWTIQVLRGIGLGLVAALIAHPLAWFYDQPILDKIMPVLGLTTILAGFESIAMPTSQRRLKVGRYALIELLGQGLGIVATVVLAALNRHWYGPSHPAAVWAIVFGSLFGSLMRLIFSHTLLPHFKHRFHLGREDLGALLRFGSWVLVSSMLTFFASQLDRLFLGKYVPLALLGVYGIALALAQLPSQIASRLSSLVMFPAFSRVHEREDFRRTWLRGRMPVVLGGALLVCGLLATGPYVIDTLYDRRYTSAGWILQFLAVGAWFQILEYVNSSVLMAQGKIDLHAFNQGVKAAALVVLVPLGFHVAGFRGIMFGLVLSDATKYVSSAVMLRRRGLGTAVRDGATSLATACLAAVGFFAGKLVRDATGHAVWGMLAAGLVVTCVFGAATFRQLRAALTHGREAMMPAPVGASPAAPQ
jgi:O-antigen/teichoic acid export membrane protein